MQMIPDGEMVVGGARNEVKLLVVDDQPDHVEHIQAFAEMFKAQCSIECKFASEREEADELLSSWSPTVVLLDVHIISDAMTFIRKLAQTGAAVVALSEARIPELAETAQSYGAVGCFTKSSNPDDVETLMGYIASIASQKVPSH
jgi:DNA-binding NarL/FixJ family response regulator